MPEALVSIEGLSVEYGPPDRSVRAVNEVSLAIGRGEIVGIVGESGSGKTSLCSALVRAVPRAARVSGKVRFEGKNLYGLTGRQLREVRRHDLMMVLQNSMTALDPLFTIGSQFQELLSQRGVRTDRYAAAVKALSAVHLTAPELRMRQYPHELSGGMRQRVLIAMATAGAPKLLIADEPTSALDATIQDEILMLFRNARDTYGSSVVIVSHDLGAIRRVCDRTVIMYAGRIVEDGPTPSVFADARHPYSRALIDSLPRVEGDEVRVKAIPGQVPSLDGLGPGCAFAPRCANVMPRCTEQQPAGWNPSPNRLVFCWDQERAAP